MNSRPPLAPLLTALLAGLLLGCSSSSGGSSGGRPPTDPGRWTQGKSLVRVYAIDQEDAVEAARRFAEQQGFVVLEREEASGGRTVSKLYSEGGRPAYEAGEGRMLEVRTTHDGAGRTKVELKLGPAFDRNQTIEAMDAFEALLPAGTQRQRER